MKKVAAGCLLLALFGAQLSACGIAPLAEPTVFPDPGEPPPEEGLGGTVDPPDAGAPGEPPADSGTPQATPDAGGLADAGTDAGTPVDAGRPPMLCAATFAGCTAFEDRTAAGAMRTITFGGNGPAVYTPRCISVRVGQQVSFRGLMSDRFNDFPLEQACGPANVVNLTAGNQANVQFTFATAGRYGYQSPQRADAGMAGVIQVLP